MDHKQSGLDLGFESAGLKQVVILMGLVAAVILAVMIGKRMSPEALAIVVGIACGLLASLPASLLLLFVLRRDELAPAKSPRPEEDTRRYPPVIIVQGGAPQALPPGTPSGYWPSAPARREFQLPAGEMIGRDDLLNDNDFWR